MTSLRLFLFVGVLLGALSSTFSQGFLQANGKAIVNSNTGDTVILKGMGLGGWMLQEGYMLQTAGFANAQYQIRDSIEALIGTANTDEFYDAWFANHCRKVDIDSLKAWGFNSVRLPMHYNLFTLPIEDEPVSGQQTWLTKGFEMTDSLLSWCSQNEMYIILDLHAAPGGQGMDAAISDYDPTKPSLWESQANRDKTVALWKRLAERYANEPWIGGYDLINETNWQLPGNALMRQLYGEITDSIRAVDNNHMIIIEGNWWANDFTGLTPPWDNNMIYSPHKYWSINDQASIQWVLDIRNTHNVPIYFGETGENSNVWFRDAITLFDEHDLGWAWWPMKKIASIAGPYSVAITPGYQDLLDYWSGNGPRPSAATAKASLMEIVDDFKLENARYQKDVIDAMFRQINSEETRPWKEHAVPGTIYGPEYDLGANGAAYFDTEVANYQVSTGNFTSWNNGWAYRNDGVDIEASTDITNTLGYGIGWTGTNEWLQYSFEVANSAVYDINVRVAANGSDGQFHFTSGEADLSRITYVPNTGGWQSWQSLTVSDVVLTPDDKHFRMFIDSEGFNFGYFEFVEKGPSTDISTDYVSAFTLDEQTVQLNVNKPLNNQGAATTDFQIRVNGNSVSVSSASFDPGNPRVMTIVVNASFNSSDVITISYSGSQINATDGTALQTFTNEPVQNREAIVHGVPGKVEAEEFFFQQGIQLESTSDVGGGQNIGFLDVGDYLDYYINVSQAGTYQVDYRHASLSETGKIDLQLVDGSGNATTLHTVDLPTTGGWQNWSTTSKQVSLPAGQKTIRIRIAAPLFNLNWFEFSFLTSVEEELVEDFAIYPNPNKGQFTVSAVLKQRQDVSLEVRNLHGQIVHAQRLREAASLDEQVDVRGLAAGVYVVDVRLEEGGRIVRRVVVE